MRFGAEVLVVYSVWCCGSELDFNVVGFGLESYNEGCGVQGFGTELLPPQTLEFWKWGQEPSLPERKPLGRQEFYHSRVTLGFRVLGIAPTNRV
mmetsp:Transcript_48127/g.75160  ORF Transcript_48127/g.75160 Transcript_48127/m.75160 type:complete len:94 (-) Transcript_48127:54-335(-)